MLLYVFILRLLSATELTRRTTVHNFDKYLDTLQVTVQDIYNFYLVHVVHTNIRGEIYLSEYFQVPNEMNDKRENDWFSMYLYEEYSALIVKARKDIDISSIELKWIGDAFCIVAGSASSGCNRKYYLEYDFSQIHVNLDFSNDENYFIEFKLE